MLTCEGYRMFFGVMQVRTSRFDAAPQDLTFKRITGSWLYKPDCECFEQGKGGTIDGKEYPDFKWTCEDFDHGTCRMMENTPCNGCFENDCSGFEWRGPQEAGKGETGK